MTNIALREIGDLVTNIKKWDPRACSSNEPFEYIDITSINQKTKCIETTQKIIPSKAPSRARQLVKANDVIISTVRPNLNAVAQIPITLEGATASTGFTILRCKPKELCNRYLYHWVRNPIFVRKMVKRATGANYPAVSEVLSTILCEIVFRQFIQKRQISRHFSYGF